MEEIGDALSLLVRQEDELQVNLMTGCERVALTHGDSHGDDCSEGDLTNFDIEWLNVSFESHLQKLHEIDSQLLIRFSDITKRFLFNDNNIFEQLGYAEAALILMTAPSIDQRVFSGELLDAISAICSKTIATYLTNELDDDGNFDDEEKVIRKLTKLFALFENVMTQVNKLEDQLLLQMLSVGLKVLAISCKHKHLLYHLQYSSIELIVSMCCNHPNQRSFVVSSLLETIGTASRPMKLHKYTHEHSIQMVTLLFLHLMQACTVESDVLVQQFIGEIVNKCAIPAEYADGADVMHWKTFVESFLEDLVTVLHDPVFPIAASCIKHLSNRLIKVIIAQKSNAHKVSKGNFRRQALKMLGAILSQVERDLKWILPSLTVDETSCDSCKSILDTDKTTCCISCSRKFHSSCLGDVYDAFHCDECAMRTQLQISASIIDDFEPTDISNHRLLYVSFLVSEYLRGQRNSKHVFEFWMPKWNVPWMKESNWSKLLSAFKMKSLRPISRFRIENIVRHLWNDLSTKTYSEQLLMFLFNIIATASSPSDRSGAVKALGSVLDVNPSLMTDTRVKQVVEQRILDDTIKVREATVDLIGKFAIARQETAEFYHQVLLERLKDQGLSVRKKVINIFIEMILQYPQLSCRIEVYIELIQRLNDLQEDDSAKKLIHQFFRLVFLENDIQVDSAITPRKKRRLSLKRKSVGTVDHIRVKRNAQDFLDLVERTQECSWLVHLLTLLFEDESISHFKSIEIQHFKRIVAILMNQLGSLQAEDAEIFTTNDLGATIEIDIAGTSMSILKAMGIFCDTNPLFMEDFVDQLVGYLDPDGLLEVDCKPDAICILLRMFTHFTKLVGIKHNHIASNIVSCCEKLALSAGNKVLVCAVELLGSIHKYSTHNDTVLVGLLSKFVNFLKQKIKPASQTKRYISNVQRSLIGIGSILSFIDRPDLEQQCFLVVFPYGSDAYEATQVKAIEALCFIFEKSPSRLSDPESTALLHEIFEKGSEKVICRLLQSMCDMLVNHEEDQPSTDVQENNTMNNIMGDQDLESISNEIQRLSTEIFRLVFHSSSIVRKQCIALVGTMLRQGLINPHLCITPMVTLECDPDFLVHETAHEFLIELEKRHPNNIVSKTIHGILDSYRYQIEILLSDVSAVVPSEGHYRIGPLQTSFSLFSRLYKDCLNGKSRLVFLASALRLFKIDTSCKPSLLELHFIAEAFVTMPFATYEEPLLIVSMVHREVTLHGETIAEFFEDIISSKKLCSVPEFYQACVNSQILILLLDLNQFLKTNYDINLKSENIKKTISPLPTELTGFPKRSESMLKVLEFHRKKDDSNLVDVLPAFQAILDGFSSRVKNSNVMDDMNDINPEEFKKKQRRNSHVN